MDTILKSGIFGSAILLLSPLLMVIGIIIMAVTRSRRAAYAFVIVALLPVIIGILGTLLGYMAVNEISKISPPQMAQSNISVGRSEARIPFYMGLTSSSILLLTAGIGISLTKKSNKQCESIGDNT